MTAEQPAERAATLRGISLVLLAMLMFACMDGVNKHLTSTYSVIQILWVRYLILLVFALLLARPRGVRQALKTRQPGMQLGRSFVLIVEKGAFIVAFSYLPVADTHAIGAIAPLMVTILAVCFLREQVGLHKALAVEVGFGGVLVIIRPGQGVFSATALIPLFAAALFAVYQVMTRAVSRDDRPDTSLLYTALVGAVVLTAVGPFDWHSPAGLDWGLLLLVGLLGTSAHFSLIKALQLAPASTLQPFNYSLFLWAIVVGFVGFDHFPDLWTLTGGVIIVGSGLYVLLRERVPTEPECSALLEAEPT